MTSPSNMYIQKKIHMIAVFLVLVGGLNWLSAVFMKKDFIQTILGNGTLTKFIYFLVGISAITMFFSRDSYLPFLGDTLVPCAAFATRTPDNANQEVVINTTPNTKVLYWASEPYTDNSGTIVSWDNAYKDYSNSGVTISDEKGKAILRIRGTPQPYSVPFKGTINPHVHFRICESNGMMSPVKSYFINNGKVESFKNFI